MYILLESVGICMLEALADLALTAGEAAAGVWGVWTSKQMVGVLGFSSRKICDEIDNRKVIMKFLY